MSSMSSVTAHHPTVAVVYGHQALDESESGPAALHQCGVVLLAMDATAAAHLRRQRVPFTTVDDWYDRAGIDPFAVLRSCEALVASRLALERPPFQESRTEHSESATAASIESWERQAWKDALSVFYVGKGLRAAAVARLLVRETAAATNQPEAFALLAWKAMLGNAVEVLPHDGITQGRPVRWRSRLSASGIGAALRGARWAFGLASLLVNVRVQCWRFGRPRLVAVLSRRELNRSRHILRSIADQTDGPTLVVPWADSTEGLALSSSLSEFPVLRLPIVPRLRRRRIVATRREIHESLRALDLGELEEIRLELHHVFESLATQAVLQAERLEILAMALERLDPDLTLCARVTEESRRVLEIAVDRCRSVLTIPHAVVMEETPWFMLERANLVHIAGIQDPTVSEGCVRVLPNALHIHEYPERSRPPRIRSRAAGEFLVVAVSDGFVDDPIATREHIALLEVLDSSASELEESVRVVFKPHPGMPDIEDAFLGSMTRRVEIFARDVDLQTLLDSADAVIAINTYGSALVHAVRRGLPIIRLWTATLQCRATEAPVEPWPRLWAQRTPAAQSAEELVGWIRRLRSEPEFRRVAEVRSRQTADVIFASDSGEDLGAILSTLSPTDRGPVRGRPAARRRARGR